MDPLGYRDEFPILQEKIYLNSCSLCALSERVRAHPNPTIFRPVGHPGDE
jgi:hypothetical protein